MTGDVRVPHTTRAGFGAGAPSVRRRIPGTRRAATLAVLTALIVGSCTREDPVHVQAEARADSTVAAPAPRVEVVGDSVTAVSEDAIRRALELTAGHVAGLPGARVAEALPPLLEAVARHPDVVVVELGVNDLATMHTDAAGGVRAAPLDEHALAADVAQGLAVVRGIECVIWVVPPVAGRVSWDRGRGRPPVVYEVLPDRLGRLRAAVEGQGRSLGLDVRILDLREEHGTDDDAHLSTDGIHPRRAGQRRYADRLAAAVAAG